MMKRTNSVILRAAVPAMVTMVVAIMLGGCATQASLPPQAAVGLKGLHTEMVYLRGQIGVTVAALEDLVRNPKDDLKTQYRVYSQELGWLLESASRAKEQKEMTTAVVEEYFMNWDEKLEQLKSQEMRAAAAERQARSEASFGLIRERVGQLRKVGAPFVSDMRDINLYLKTDLTRDGLRTIQETTNRVINQREDVIFRLDAAIKAVDAALSG